MSYKDVQERNAEESRKLYRQETARSGLGTARPAPRVVDGHTRPCTECGAVDWVVDNSRGEVSCGGCGIVVEENRIDPGAEWTNHDSTIDRSRVGAPSTYTLADKGLNTSISASDLTSSAAARHGMSSSARRAFRRMRLYDERSKTGARGTRNLVKPNQMIRDKSGLPKSAQEEACRVYKKLSEDGFVTGRSIAGVSAACCYLIARQHDIPRQIKHVAEAFEVDEKMLSRMIRQIGREVKLVKISKPSDYFGKFLSDLQLPPNIRSRVDAIWKSIEEYVDVWQGKKPMGVAAAIIYKAASESGHKRTQAEICKVANVSEVTLRGLNKDLANLFETLSKFSNN